MTREEIEHYFDTQIKFVSGKLAKTLPHSEDLTYYKVELKLLNEHKKRILIYQEEQYGQKPKSADIEIIPISRDYLLGYKEGVTDAVRLNTRGV